jgi:RNA polymerase sigma-70 factor (ECF subfamily)
VDELKPLAAAAADGDPLAAAALVRATQGEVWRLCAFLADARIAENLTQETFLRAFAALPGFEGRASVRTWLLSIARRVCADHLRTKKRRLPFILREAAELEDLHPAGDTGDRIGEQIAATDAVARLAPERREAFVLTQLIGLSYAETAAILDCPVGTVRSRVSRAREDLIRSFAHSDQARGRR